MRTAIFILLIVWTAASVPMTVAMIGKERKPLTHGVAITSMVVQALTVWAYVVLFRG